MRGHYLEILGASLILIIPMLVLTAVLLSLIYTHLMPDYNSRWGTTSQTLRPLGDAYYINYGATRLVFISSVSSTLAPFLISAAMLLFSFPLARSIAQNSDRDATAKLPCPYQLELLIEVVDARIKSLWPMVRYAFGSKQRRVAIIPDLWKSMIMLFSLVVLA